MWNLVGIKIHVSDNCEVLRNLVTNHPNYLSTAAVYLWYAGSSIVNGNNLSSGGFYIYKDWELLSLENNLIGGRQFGFFVHEENLELMEHIYSQIILYECANVNISFQIIQNVTIGIQLYNCVKIYIHDCSLYNNRHGIKINRGGDHIINSNELRKNYLGLYSYLSLNNSISYNMLKENTAFGLCLFFCERNIIHHNLFIDNNLGNPMFSHYSASFQSQAFDETRENILASSMDIWYDEETKQGNYWNDYTFSCSDSSIEYRIAADPITHSYFYVDSYPLFIDMSGCYTPSTTSSVFSFVALLILLPAVVYVLRKR
ncbi:MAG: NosD domain-containing protein, partial [Candidatus Heimdallarchaeaceae archaeon]